MDILVVRSLPAELHHDLDGVHFDVAKVILTVFTDVDNWRQFDLALERPNTGVVDRLIKRDLHRLKCRVAALSSGVLLLRIDRVPRRGDTSTNVTFRG